MTLGEMRTDVYSRLSYKSSPDQEVVARMDRFINEAQRELVTMRGLARLRRATLTFSSVANVPFAVLPQAAVRIAGIQDRTSQRSLREISIQNLRFRDPGLTNLDSNPNFYVIINMSAALARDPSAAAEIFIKSTDAGDVGTVYAQGVITGGYPQTSSVAMTGATAVSLGLTNWLTLQKLFLSTAALGTITIHQTSGIGTELARIVPGRLRPRYTKIQLYGTPTQALDYYCDVDLAIEDLAIATDSPYLPEDFHWLLPCGAMRKEWVKRKDPENYNIETARWKIGVADLKGFCRQVTDDGHGGRGGYTDFNGTGGVIWGSSPYSG